MTSTMWAQVVAQLGAVGACIYLLWHIVTITLPRRDAEFTTELKATRLEFTAELRQQREDFRQELRQQREDFHRTLEAEFLGNRNERPSAEPASEGVRRQKKISYGSISYSGISLGALMIWSLA